MQLFSRNKAIVALSLGALALGACGDDVTVPVAPAAPVTVTITPPSANMNIGEALNFAVQISGGSTTAAPTLQSCVVTPATVATATVAGSACRVTAVAAGNATVTATASTGQIAAASIAVSAPAPAIISLSVSPSAAQLAVGASVTIVPTVQPAGRTATYTYTTSSATIASVTAAGVVTAVAPGVATITVSATGTATGFTTATINQAVTITVSDRAPGLTSLTVQPSSLALALGATQQLTASVQGPRASAVTYTYGSSAPSIANSSATGVVTAIAPGTAVITVTASSTESGAFAATAITALVPVTVTPNAQVVITSLTDNGSTIDITNVAGQFEVNLSVQPNGQNVSSVQAWVCNPAETVAACAARTNGIPAAQQSFSASGAQASNIQLYINSAEFTTPNFESGADASTLYRNGLKTIVATLTTTPAASSTVASNNISQVNFNNQDGWTIQWNQPTNRANDANGITWYGGPSTPDALTPSATSGTGTFTVVPVIYTENRTIASATFNFVDNSGNFSCGNAIQSTTRPFRATYGTNARSTTQGSLNFNCGTRPTLGVLGAVSDASGYAPIIVSSVDNNNAAGPNSTGLTPAAATSIYTPISASAIGNPANAGRYRQSLAFRPTTIFIPGDYRSPVVANYDVRGGGGSGVYVDSAWVNGTFSFAGGFSASTGNPNRLSVSDIGVGLLGGGATTSARNAQFLVCAFPSSFSGSAATNCTTPVSTGGITATPATMTPALGESADLTNQAYIVQIAETDRLGNRGLSVLSSWSNSNTGEAQTQTPGNNTSAAYPSAFGVDLTAPVIVALPNDPAATGTNPFMPNYVRTDADSIYSTLGNTYGTTNAANAVFAARFNDSRSGFAVCGATNCPTTGANPGIVNAGTFQILRHTRSQLVSVSNAAVAENLIRSSNTGSLWQITAVVANGDAANRDFTVNIFGDAARAPTGSTAGNIALLQGASSAVAGYYRFTGTLRDRAGNTTALTQRSVAIDNAAPQISSIAAPPVLAGATTVSFSPVGTDDLEAIAGDLALRYPQLAVEAGVASAQATNIRFRRVPNFSTTPVLGLWHNPFQTFDDGLLSTPVGAGVALSNAGLRLPIPFIQQIQTVGAGNAPVAPNTIATSAMKPDQVTGYLYDIRATATSTGTPGSLYGVAGISTAATAALNDGQITQPAQVKNWTATTVTGTQAAIGISTWGAFNLATPGTVEFRVATNTSVTNPPFTRVEIIRAGATEWTHLGQATFAGVLDQGSTRFFRYTFSYSGQAQGQGDIAALANLDVLRAIGVDAQGNALSTNNSQIGGNLASVTSISASPAGPIFVPVGGGNYSITPTVVQPAGAVPASVTYNFTTSGGMTATNVNGAIAITAAPTGSAGVLTITAFAPASSGFNSTTVTTTVNFVTGAAGVTAVAIASGSIPSTLNPGQTFTLTASATQPLGAPAVTYSWSTPTGFTQSASGSSVTYTYTGTQTYVAGPITITLTGSTPTVAPTYSAATATATTTNASVNGFINNDSPWSIALTVPQATINAGAAYVGGVTNNNVAGLVLNANVCTSSNNAAATITANPLEDGAYTITGVNTLPNALFTAATTVTFTCTQSRNSQLLGATNYFTRSTPTTVSSLILPFGLQAVTLSPTGPSTVAAGQTLIVTPTATLATGAGAVTYTVATSNGAAATATVSGGVVTITGVAAGTATITVTGTVPSTASATVGNAVSQTIFITVAP